jgi:hypothetical protein
MAERLKGAQMNINDDMRFGWPLNTTPAEVKKLIDQHVRNNRSINQTSSR